MKQHGLIEPLNEVFEDKHSDNPHILSDILTITAKLKQKTSFTDILLQLQMQNLDEMHSIMNVL